MKLEELAIYKWQDETYRMEYTVDGNLYTRVGDRKDIKTKVKSLSEYFDFKSPRITWKKLRSGHKIQLSINKEVED